MSALSDYLELKLLDHVLGTAAFTKPANVYLSLHTSDPGESGTGGEVSGGSYARVALVNNSTNFPPCATTGEPVKSNGSTISFPTATASWGTVTHWALYDASSGGNMLFHGAFATSRVVSSGKTPKVASGALTISLVNASAGGLTTYAKRKLLDHVLGSLSFSAPSAVYVGIGTALSGETLTEWSDSGYSRQETGFDAAASGAAPNTDSETFNASVDLSSTLTHYGVWDDATVGNLLFVGSLNTTRYVETGDSVSMNSGVFIVSAD